MFEVQFNTQGQLIHGTAGSFGQGYKPLPQIPSRMSEDDVLAKALYLERMGLVEEADCFLDAHTY